MVMDSDECSLSTKIHYAQLAGASLLLIKYVDDKIEEAEVDTSSFSGVKIPVLLLKDSEAKYIYEVLRSVGRDTNKMVVEVDYQLYFDKQMKEIQVFMTSNFINNPMINFLRDLLDHHHLLRKYELNIKYVVGQCAKCKDNNFMAQESGCLSGGRYCLIDTDYK
jgi:hypothetical protein